MLGRFRGFLTSRLLELYDSQKYDPAERYNAFNRLVHAFIRVTVYACATLVTVTIAAAAITLIHNPGTLPFNLLAQSSSLARDLKPPDITAASGRLRFIQFLEASPTVSETLQRRNLASSPALYLPDGCDIRHHGALFDPTRWAGSFHAGTMTWRPTEGRYLLLFCYVGQISNRELCFRNHLALAGLLNRTLVVPSHPREVVGGYDYQLVFDFNHTRNCLGNDDVILTTHEYKERFGQPIRIDRVLCWHSPSDICNDPKSFPLLYFICPAVNVSSPDLPPSGPGGMAPTHGSQRVYGFALGSWFFSGQTVQLPDDRTVFAACLPVRAKLRSVVDAYSQVSDSVLVAGDLHNVHFANWREFEASVDLPFAREPACPDALLVRPAEGIFQAASLAQQELFGGEPYVSIHWRRGDFKEWCALHGEKDACYYPPRQVAWFVSQHAKALGLSNVFLATNGNHEEVRQLIEVFDWASNSTNTSIAVKRLTHDSPADSAWRSIVRPWMEQGQGSLTLVAVEKVLCARGQVFFGSPLSSFTQDIVRMRHGLRTASCSDTMLCHGEKEWDKEKG